MNESVGHFARIAVEEFLRAPILGPLLFVISVFVAGCNSVYLRPDPELAPPAAVDRVWIPPLPVSTGGEASVNIQQLEGSEDHPALQPAGRAFDLPALIDLALQTNPQTRRTWYAAQAANAQLGQAEAINYPAIAVDADGGYFKLPLQFPGQTLVIRNEAFLPQIKVSYDLLDFGRTRAAERGAREQLIAANFTFDRAIQDVVFNIEKAYYVLSAANASVSAAVSNLELARTSLDAVLERHHVGLATQPQISLAKQVEAQAVYDLENAKSMVHDAQSSLFDVIGIAPNAPITVQSIAGQKVPANLGGDVETMIAESIKKRPDIAAQIAAVRAGDAAIAGAEAEYYPEVGISGNYGQIIWSYTVNGGNTQNLNQPFYGALLTLKWNLFTGFDRYYSVGKATAERNAARAELKSLELDATATVWRSYYDFLSAKKKYQASQALLHASQDAYDSNLESHRQGLATITDLIGAERDLMAARYTLIQSQADFLIASSALVHAVGAQPAFKAP